MDRCQYADCNRKIPLMMREIRCKCNLSFCYKHRLPETHNCNYDYKLNKKEMDNAIITMKCKNRKIEVI